MSDTFNAIEVFDGKNSEAYLFELENYWAHKGWIEVRLIDHPANGSRRGAHIHFPERTVTAVLRDVGEEYVKAMLPKEEGANTERTKDEVRQRYQSFSVSELDLYRNTGMQALEWAFPWLLADDAE